MGRGELMANPLYRQIAEDLRAQIESGELHSGERLQTESELQDRYGASRNTVRDAIKSLTTLGVVETCPGQGTFVVRKIGPVITVLTNGPFHGGVTENTSYRSDVNRDNVASISGIQVEMQQASEDVAASLQLEVGTAVISRHERCFIDDIPWTMRTSYYPDGFAARGAERLRSPRDIEEGAVKYLADVLHLHQNGYRDWITVRAPNPVEADFFKLPPDGRVVVYEIFRTVFDSNLLPMRLTVTVSPADRNQFVVYVGQVPDPIQSGSLGPEDVGEARSY
jgi:GntR family transcriptional regulator